MDGGHQHDGRWDDSRERYGRGSHWLARHAEIDNSRAETATQRASVEYVLSAGRFEWATEGWFNPTELGLAEGQPVYLLYVLSGTNLSVAARIHMAEDSLRAGIVVQQPDGSFKGLDSSAVIGTGVWRKWRLHFLRIATRETTAVLYLNEGEQMVEQTRINRDLTAFEPRRVRAGIGLSSAGATATVLTDELRLTESLV
jgi:hypothetical protein